MSRTFVAVDLSKIAPADETPTLLMRDDGTGLLYPGLTHAIAGPPGSGKSYLALYGVAETLSSGGRAMWLDWESSPAVLRKRATTLGISAALLTDLRRFGYYQPPGALSDDDIKHISTMAQPGDLVVFDALAPALAAAGVEENSNTGVSAWWNRVVRPLTDRGATVLLIDHTSIKPLAGRQTARGASAKLAVVSGAAFLLEPTTPFARGSSGSARLVVAKDRPGGVGHAGETAADVHFADRNGELLIQLRSSEIRSRASAVLPTAEVVEFVSAQNEIGVNPSIRGIRGGIRRGMRATTEAVHQAVEDGRLERVRVGGRGGGDRYQIRTATATEPRPNRDSEAAERTATTAPPPLGGAVAVAVPVPPDDEIDEGHRFAPLEPAGGGV